MANFTQEVRKRRIAPGGDVSEIVSRAQLYNLRKLGLVEYHPKVYRGNHAAWTLTAKGYEATR